MATLKTVKIFPTIGIARLGNSPEWYIGTELPFPAPPPVPPGGTYKDAQCRIKRQAQRFRLFGYYDDNSVMELTT
ncbi:MAG TPA: LodA/GoxA family CTQ-dependent oxidase, partial [Ktedonobacteraceae bacterium]